MAKFNEDAKGNVKVYFGTGDMPMKVYEEFESIVQREYGNVRWLAIKDMMGTWKREPILTDLHQRIEILEQDMMELVNKDNKEEEPQKELTLGSKHIVYTTRSD